MKVLCIAIFFILDMFDLIGLSMSESFKEWIIEFLINSYFSRSYDVDRLLKFVDNVGRKGKYVPFMVLPVGSLIEEVLSDVKRVYGFKYYVVLMMSLPMFALKLALHDVTASLKLPSKEFADKVFNEVIEVLRKKFGGIPKIIASDITGKEEFKPPKDWGPEVRKVFRDATKVCPVDTYLGIQCRLALLLSILKPLFVAAYKYSSADERVNFLATMLRLLLKGMFESAGERCSKEGKCGELIDEVTSAFKLGIELGSRAAELASSPDIRRVGLFNQLIDLATKELEGAYKALRSAYRRVRGFGLALILSWLIIPAIVMGWNIVVGKIKSIIDFIYGYFFFITIGSLFIGLIFILAGIGLLIKSRAYPPKIEVIKSNIDALKSRDPSRLTPEVLEAIANQLAVAIPTTEYLHLSKVIEAHNRIRTALKYLEQASKIATEGK